MNRPRPKATQVRHPWRATTRTVFAALVGLASLVPLIVAAGHVETIWGVTQLLAVTGAVTRILAIPGVNEWLRQYLPWLAPDSSKD